SAATSSRPTTVASAPRAGWARVRRSPSYYRRARRRQPARRSLEPAWREIPIPPRSGSIQHANRRSRDALLRAWASEPPAAVCIDSEREEAAERGRGRARGDHRVARIGAPRVEAGAKRCHREVVTQPGPIADGRRLATLE